MGSGKSFDPFLANAPILCPLEMPESFGFLVFSEDIK